MKKLIFIIILLNIFLTKTLTVEAACLQATGFPLSCDSTQTRCLVGRGGGGAPRALLCCTTPQECDATQIEAGMPGVNDFQDICRYAGSQQGTCESCAAIEGVWTAIGCIPATQSGLFSKIFTLGLSMAGGIAFLLILFGGFQILTSAGNPEQLNEGRELVSSAVAGLLLIIFSVFLLRLVGYDILRIPGFGA